MNHTLFDSFIRRYRPGRRKLAGLMMPLLVVTLATGCLSRPALVKQSFAFAPPSIISNAPVRGNRVLLVRKLTVEAPFDGHSLVYRTGEFSYEHDPYAQFLVSPAEGFVLPIQEFFRANGAFQAVSEPGSALKPNTVLEISVNQLYGDFRKSGEPAAVLGMRFLFFDAPNGLPGNLLSAKSYLQRVSLQGRTPAALVEGWNQALNQILTSATGDFTVAIRPPTARNGLNLSTASEGGADIQPTNHGR